MTEKKLKWGILGAARINQQLMPAIVQAHNSQLVAIASRRPGAALETLTKYAAEEAAAVTCYDELELLLQSPDIDAVYIPMANHEHVEWTLKAIDSGKHVLCEKPMALTVADINAIEQAAKAKNVKVMEGFMYRFHPQHQRVQEIIAEGLIGEVRFVRSCFSFMMQEARKYRLAEPVINGGGAMWDIGCYAIHAARLPFMGLQPISVTAMANYLENGADLSCSGVVDFADGRYAQFDFSFQRARRAEYEIIGTLGGLKCHNVWAKQAETPVLSWWTEKTPVQQESLPLNNHFVLEVEHFSDCVLNDNAPQLTLADAKENCQIINAAIQSAESKKLIEL